MDLFDNRESYLHSMDAKFVGHIEIFNEYEVVTL